jgi:hypothetical protein
MATSKTQSDPGKNEIGLYGTVALHSPPLASSLSQPVPLRINENIPDAGHRPTSVSAAGGTSGIAQCHHISPTRTLGAFVPTNNPFFQTVANHTKSVSCVQHTDITCFRTILVLRLQGLLVGVKAPSPMAMN